MNRVSLRKSQEKQGFSATMSGFWGPEGDWGIRRVAYVGWARIRLKGVFSMPAVPPDTRGPLSSQPQYVLIDSMTHKESPFIEELIKPRGRGLQC